MKEEIMFPASANELKKRKHVTGPKYFSAKKQQQQQIVRYNP